MHARHASCYKRFVEGVVDFNKERPVKFAKMCDELILVPCEVTTFTDWWIVERAIHDGREWEEYSDDGMSAFSCRSARIVDGDIEGPGYEMRAVAQAIEQDRSVRFKRCQVTWTASGYLMSRPKGGSAPVLVSHDIARHLAADILRKIGHEESSTTGKMP
jgi:hypothetical protein